jgi:hypothetical protein
MHSKCKGYDYYNFCLNLNLESAPSLIVVSQLFLPVLVEWQILADSVDFEW